MGVLCFGEFRVDLAARVLSGPAGPVQIQRKPLDVLIYLLREAPRLVGRRELLDQFWSRAVNEEALTRCVSTLRKLLGDLGDPPRFIETHRGQGYRFVAPVEAEPGRPASADPTAERLTVTGPRPEAPIAEQPARARADSKSWRGRLVAAVLLTALGLTALWVWRPEHAPVGPELIDRIAVLPIPSPTGADEWLAPALTDHLMQALSRIEGVTVVATPLRSTGTGPVGPRTLGRRLDVEALLVSALEAGDDGVRLRSRLVSTSDGELLWTSSVDTLPGAPRSVMVEDLARSVANRLRPTLQLQEPRLEVDAAAYRHYLQGRYYWSLRSLTGLRAALQAFDAALAREPDYPDALVGAAETWLLLPLYGAMPPTQAMPQARRLAARALEVDALNARARAVLGVIAMQFDWDWARAEDMLRAAVTRNPNDATAQQWLGELYCYTGRTAECRRRLEVALDLDPLSPLLRWLQGSPQLWSGDFTGAVTTYSAALAEDPGSALGRYSLGLAYAGLGDWDNAIAAYLAALPELGVAIVGGPLVYALASAGELAAARARLAELEALTEERYVPPTKLAVAHLGLGDRDRAMDWLAEAIGAHDDRLVYLAVDVHFRGLHDDPALREIAAEIGLAGVLDSR